MIKLTLWAVGLYHVVFGLMTFLSRDLAVQIAKDFFGMTIVANDQIIYLAKLLGIYAFIFGIVMFVAARKPDVYRAFIWVGVVLYAVRIVNRIVFSDLVRNAFLVSSFAFWMEIILLTFFGGLLYILRPKQ